MINPQIYTEICEFYPILKELNESLQYEIQGECQRVQGGPDQVVFRPGDDCSIFLFIVQGGMKITKTLGEGREILLYNLRPGDTCVLTASGILGNHSYTAQGIWECQSLAYWISARCFLRLIERSSEFRGFIFHTFSDRIAGLMELVDSIMWKSISSRLAQLLLNKPTEIKIEYTHQMLANELGTAREVISRSLKELERQGLIKRERMTIRIENKEGLQKIATNNKL